MSTRQRRLYTYYRPALELKAKLAIRKAARLKHSAAGTKAWFSQIHNAAVRHGVAA